MSQKYKEITVEEDEITLKELLLKLKDYWKTVIKNFWIIILVAAIVGVVFLAKAWIKIPVYSAEMTFTIANTEKTGGNSGVSGILGQFGLGGASSGDGLNIQRAIALAASREIIESVIFEEIELDEENDYIANHIIKIYKLQEEWGKNSKKFLDFTFLNSKVDSFDRTENEILQRLHRKVIGTKKEDPILKIEYEEETGIFSMLMNTISEDLSMKMLEKQYDVLSKYYVEKAIEPQQKRYNSIKIRMDSITRILGNLDYSVARYTDRSYGLLDNESTVQGKRLNRDQQLANVAYAEIKRNLEVADFALSSVTPIFQTIDEAILPLPKRTESKIENTVIGILIGSFLAILFVVGRKIIRDAMKED